MSSGQRVILPDYSVRLTREHIIANRSSDPIPHELLLYVSDQCNFRCKMCAFRAGRQHPVMSLEDWKHLVSETFESGVHYTLFGGEPLLYDRIDDLVRHIGKIGARMTIVTNGFFLDAHLESLLENHCHIVLSLDGLQETHDSIRGCPGSFQKIHHVLERMKKEYPDELRKLVSVNSVLLPENAAESAALVDYLYAFGVRTLTFQHLQFYGDTERNATDLLWKDYLGCSFPAVLQPRAPFEFTENALNRIRCSVAALLEKRKDYPDMAIWIYPILDDREIELYYSDEHARLYYVSTCLDPWVNASVSPDGGIYLCLGAKVGNYLEEGFWPSWFGEKARTFRDFVFRNRFPVCTRCCHFYNSYVSDI